jgi:hypothetical protein
VRAVQWLGASHGPAMTERNSDIDFDFFDEPETAETVEAQRLPRRGGQGPPGPPRQPTSLMPLLRLVGLVALVIAVVMVIVFVAKGCASSSKQAKYRDYMEQVSRLGSQSAAIGKTFNTQLTTPGIKVADLESDLRGDARSQQVFADQAARIKPPGPLRAVHQHVVESLQFRVSGLNGLADAIAREGSGKAVAGAGARLASQAERFVASDVVWDDLFKTPAQQALEQQNVTGVSVPDSSFVVNPDLASRRTMAAILQRIRGAALGPTTGGLHGTGIVSTQALPGRTTLSETSETKVPVGLNLGFAVTVKDTGNSLETQIPVTLTIEQKKPIVRTQKIDLIQPGDSKTLVFRNFQNPTLGELVKVKVEVTPVPNETHTTNNSAEYPVIFSLP